LDSDFSAGLAQREHLAGIEPAVRIERGANASHQGEIVGRKHQLHQFILFHADAVLARERASDIHAVPHNFSACRDNAFELLRVALVKQNERVKIAVTCMKNVADL
jgi:hypothetical protein